MWKYFVIILFAWILGTGCGLANVNNKGPESKEIVTEKDEGPSSTWTVVIEDNCDKDKKEKKK